MRPENIVPYRILAMVKGQYIMGFGGPVDINLAAVLQVMDLYGVESPERKQVFEKVVAAAREMMADARAKREAEKK